jgi:hypothetical protein
MRSRAAGPDELPEGYRFVRFPGYLEEVSQTATALRTTGPA